MTTAHQPAAVPIERPYQVRFGYWWWALPALLFVATVIYASTASGAFFAFTNWTGIGTFDFTGLDNFRKIFTTPEFVGSLVNTLLLAAGYLVLTNVFGLLFALAVNRMLKTRYLLRTLLFMPFVLSPLAVSYIWKFIFSWDGALNQGLRSVGLAALERDWLADPTTALWCVLIVMVWQNIGFAMVIFLAGLATVPIELEEAAALDGAGVFRRFRYVTLPMIQPAVVVSMTLALVQGLRVFDQVMALTSGGPAGATHTLATQVYLETFMFQQFGFGAALALVLSALILIFASLQFAATRRLSGEKA